jgi:hypothetical protein
MDHINLHLHVKSHSDEVIQTQRIISVSLYYDQPLYVDTVPLSTARIIGNKSAMIHV